MVRADGEPGDQGGGWLAQKTDDRLYWSSGYGEAAERKELRNIQAAETGKGQWLLG